LQKSAEFVRSLRPVLAECGSRINLENHGDSTFDLLQVVEAVGEDICGICFDTANTLVNAEDPVLAAKRVAPYTHMSHCKDGLTFFTANGVSRQGKPPGQGVVDFAQIIPILGAYNRDLRLSIEDHKMIFEFRIFDRDWMAKNPKLNSYELGQYVKLAAEAEKRLARGELPGVDEYEAAPFVEEMEQRLTDGAAFLRGLLIR
jgi:sugar phosphate isomerase/epimerase